MFSSTELIRKSKKIFDKLHASEIDKAIILRDGKPSLILLDFDKYEKIMQEYLELKGHGDIVRDNKNIKSKPDITKTEEKDQKSKTKKKKKEIDDAELQRALEEIEKLDFGEEDTEKMKEIVKEKKKEPLKEFWD
jgi:PHD/YefM family antitoxin component YafN of YafNO toxin-antitoxin module